MVCGFRLQNYFRALEEKQEKLTADLERKETGASAKGGPASGEKEKKKVPMAKPSRMAVLSRPVPSG